MFVEKKGKWSGEMGRVKKRINFIYCANTGREDMGNTKAETQRLMPTTNTILPSLQEGVFLFNLIAEQCHGVSIANESLGN